MWDWIRKFINWLFGLQPETPAKVSEVSAEAGIATEECSDLIPVTPSDTKAEAVTYQEIDWLNAPPQYHKRKSVLSFQERELYRLLRAQVGNDYHVFPMVRMADVLWLLRSKHQIQQTNFGANRLLPLHIVSLETTVAIGSSNSHFT